MQDRVSQDIQDNYGAPLTAVSGRLDPAGMSKARAFEPRSRRPKTSPSAISPDTVELITRIRKELAGQGLDAGPQTIAWHLDQHHHLTVSPATVSRYLAPQGLVTRIRPSGRSRPASGSPPRENRILDSPNGPWCLPSAARPGASRGAAADRYRDRRRQPVSGNKGTASAGAQPRQASRAI